MYISLYNRPAAKRRVDDKLRTKRLLFKNNIPTSPLIAAFHDRQDLKNFSWQLPKEGFVVKPSRGYGGEGILVFREWDKGGSILSGKYYSIKHLKSHILDIFDGIYSLQGLPDKAYIEEKITPHPFFKKLAPLGLPDIRIIVFNRIPIMAMLRLPTEESGGRANLHQGAIGIGIGMRTGITERAIWRNKSIRVLPKTKVKAGGIKIPNWDEILALTSRAQFMSGLGYAGVDIVIDKKTGPLVLEINSRPGLSIQNVNFASLRSRLERVDNLNVKSTVRGVEIAKSVFAEDFSDKVRQSIQILSIVEPIKIIVDKNVFETHAKIDTGAYRTSLDLFLVKQLRLPIIGERQIITVSASGRELRKAVKITFELKGRRISTIASIARRSHLRFPVIVGRRDLAGFYVNPTLPLNREKQIMLLEEEE